MKITFEHIVADLKSVTSFEAIDELMAHLVSAGSVSLADRETIAYAIKQREQSMSTGIGFGVAIPHASTSLVPDAVMAFGRSRAGIDFDALDRQPVRFVVLVIVPAGEREKHLRTLTQISRLFQKKEIRLALETATDADAIAKILNGRQAVAA